MLGWLSKAAFVALLAIGGTAALAQEIDEPVGATGPLGQAPGTPKGGEIKAANGAADRLRLLKGRGIGTRIVNVAVIVYNPILKSKGGARLTEHMKWQDARRLADGLVAALKETSSGYADYRIAEYIELDAFPQKRDGFNYTETSFLEMWADRSKAHQPDSVSYATVFSTNKLTQKIKDGEIDEVWLWGAPYFGWDEYAMRTPGDRLFYRTSTPWFYRPYDIPDCGRTVWVMGFNYERGLAEALHSFGHRAEGILSLTVGKGIWDDEKTPNNIWNRFTRQASKFPKDAQVGNVHGGPNATSGYDYQNKTSVQSAADDWLNYPKLTGRTTAVNCESWGGPDYHLNYMKWWFARLPNAAGVTDGFCDNWWKYVIDYDATVKAQPPPGGKPEKAAVGQF